MKPSRLQCFTAKNFHQLPLFAVLMAIAVFGRMASFFIVILAFLLQIALEL